MPDPESPPLPPANAPGGALTGQLLGGRYRVGALLGAGAMGCVYRAEHVDLGRPCAVKVIRADAAGRGGYVAALARFRVEALAGARLDHPNVLRVLDFGREPGGGPCYLVCEHLGGRDLADVLSAEGRLPEARAARIGAQIAAALQHAHDRGVIHRDLKPANVRIVRRSRDEGGDAEEVKLLDFGTALIEGVPVSDGSVIGTPAYMSPEQLTAGPLDRRSDLYALGVVLFELVTGHVPFEQASVTALALAHVQTPPPRPSAFAGPLDPELEAVILACLRKLPGDRPADARAVRETLERVAHRARIRGTRAPREALPSLPVPSRPRRRLPIAALAGAAAVVGVWIAIVAELGTSGTSPEPIEVSLGSAARRLPDAGATEVARVAPEADAGAPSERAQP